MSGEETNDVRFITKAVFNPASLTGTYQVMNGSGFSDDVKIFEMFNPSTTVSIDISYDGVNNHDFIGTNQAKIRDFQANHSDISGSGTKYGRKGQLVWGKIAESPTFIQMIGSR